MKYKLEIEIIQPFDTVIAFFDNIDNMKKWIQGLQRFEPLSGIPGEAGCLQKGIF